MGSYFSTNAIEEKVPPIEKIFSEETTKQFTKLEENYSNIKLDYQNIVCAGGGVKGIAEVGVLMIMKKMIDCGIIINSQPSDSESEYKFTDVCDLNGFAGTSFGSIIATLLAVGYSTEELYSLVYGLDFGKFEDRNSCLIADVHDFATKFGVCAGKKLEDQIGMFIKEKTGNSEYTFRDLYVQRKKNLVVVGTDMNTMQPVYFSHQTYPDLALKVGVRISASLPFFFQPKIITEVNGNLTEKKYYIDGGVLDNYPVHIFDHDTFGKMYNSYHPVQKNDQELISSLYNKNTIGIRIMNKQYESVTNNKYELHNTSIDGLQSYITAFLNVYLYGQEKFQMVNGYWERTISVQTEYIPITQFSISNDQKNSLIIDGVNGAIEYFNKLALSKL